jgi:hypothetical protein
VNQDLQQLVVNELQHLEVVALRLYSGPMYKRYNDTARGQVKGVYPTMITLISSGQIKLSKVTIACRVYRGLSGGQLPRAFYKPIERAFMSTTTKLDVASEYAAGKGAGKIGLVYEMEMGVIDRGADLSLMSQYPDENEILFAPLTGLEVKETVQKGNVLHITTRLNTNLKVQTIEEMQSKMKNRHLGMVDILKEGLQRASASVFLNWADSSLMYTSADFYLAKTKKALECQQDICQGALFAADVAAGDPLFDAAATQITESQHFATMLCKLDDEKAARFAALAPVTEIAFRHIGSIDKGVLCRLSITLTSRPRRSIVLDLTGEAMTDGIKTLAGEALLNLDGGGASISSIRTDQYTIGIALHIG